MYTLCNKKSCNPLSQFSRTQCFQEFKWVLFKTAMLFFIFSVHMYKKNTKVYIKKKPTTINCSQIYWIFFYCDLEYFSIFFYLYRLTMDKSWMTANRTTEAFSLGVEEFLKFSSIHAGGQNCIR